MGRSKSSGDVNDLKFESRYSSYSVSYSYSDLKVPNALVREAYYTQMRIQTNTAFVQVCKSTFIISKTQQLNWYTMESKQDRTRKLGAIVLPMMKIKCVS